MSARKKAADAPTIPEQSDEARKATLTNAPKGLGTATGVEHERLFGDQEDRIKNLESRGSTVPIAGGDEIKADFAASESAAPVGAQAQPANWTSNGVLPPNMVASPSGPVPVSSVTSSIEEAQKRSEENLKSHEDFVLRSGGEKLSRDRIEGLQAADLRAIAHDRGYDLGEYAGNRVTRRRFIEAQDGETVGGEGSGETGAAATE